MRLLLDTQIIFWWLVRPEFIPAGVPPLIESADDDVLVSGVSLWEMAIKISSGKMDVDLVSFTQNVERGGFTWLPIENMHLLRVAELPTHADHRDPFDRLLVAQSQCEPAILVTTDKKLARYGETVRLINR